MLRALPQVPEARLWLAGEGPERDALHSLAAELGVAGRVHFLGWRDDVGALMRSADLFVCPSRHEGLGGIVLEVWYHRCPIVATASQGPAELIEDGATGRLVPVDAVDDLAGAINAVISSPTQAGGVRGLPSAPPPSVSRSPHVRPVPPPYRGFRWHGAPFRAASDRR